MKIYNELESLGFFEWLKEKGFGSSFTPIILDAQPFDSIERGGYNSIAFRWFREKYKLIVYIQYYAEWNFEIFRIGELAEPIDDIDVDYTFKGGTYEEAELECLKKLIEILKEKNNGAKKN